jgi:glutamate synthase domain-containing protein 3
VNKEMVGLEDLSDPEDQETVQNLVRRHVEYTGSVRGRWVLDHWDEIVGQAEDAPGRFVKVMPIDYKAALQKMKEEQVAAHG